MKTATANKPRDEREARALDLYERYEAMSPLGKAAVENLFKACDLVSDANAIEDANLIAAARNARREVGNFTKMFRTIKVVNGVLEMTRHTIDGGRGEPADDVNWTVVCDAIKECLRRIGPVYSAASRLEDFEREQVARGERWSLESEKTQVANG